MEAIWPLSVLEMYEMILSFDSMPDKNKTFSYTFTHIHITAELLNWQNKTTLNGFFLI